MIWTPERIQAARQSFETWHGTPFGLGPPKIGLRIDCTNFVARVLIESGIAPDVRLPRMKNEGQFSKSDKLLNAFEACLFTERHKPDEAQFGDIAICSTGITDGHCGFIDLPDLWHCLSGNFVMRSEYRVWRSRVACVLRITKEGLRKSPISLR